MLTIPSEGGGVVAHARAPFKRLIMVQCSGTVARKYLFSYTRPSRSAVCAVMGVG